MNNDFAPVDRIDWIQSAKQMQAAIGHWDVGDIAKPGAFLIGNGLSRLVEPPSNTDAGWADLAAHLLKVSGATAPQTALNQLSVLEQLAYGMDCLKARRSFEIHKLLSGLWRLTELAVPSELHRLIVRSTNLIVTTNYDTLIERAALAEGRRIDIIIASAERLAIVSDMGNPADRHKLTIFKVHGSFPFDESLGSEELNRTRYLDDWLELASDFYDKKKMRNTSALPWNGGGLVFTYGDYLRRAKALGQLTKKLDYKIRDLRGHALVIMGYGISASDSNILPLLDQFDFTKRYQATFADGPASELRGRTVWSVDDSIDLRAVAPPIGMSRAARLTMHLMFTRLMQGEQKRVVLDLLSPLAEPGPSALFLGQSHLVHMAGIETRPVHEASYNVVFNTPIAPGTLAPSASKKLSSKRALEGWDIGGQCLIPATFVAKWGFRSELITLYGQDKEGEDIERFLNGVVGLHVVRGRSSDLEYSDRAIAVAFDGIRLIVDNALSNDPKHQFSAQQATAAGRDMYGREPALVYLSEWFIHESVQGLNALKDLWKRRPIFLLETGSFGSPDLCGHEATISRARVCDIILASSAFTLCVARFPLVAHSMAYPDRSDLEPNAYADELRRQSSIFCQRADQPYGQTAYQMLNFVSALNGAVATDRLADFIDAIFENKALEDGDNMFDSASLWVVTLGEMGAICFHREVKNDFIWVRPVARTDVRNALACGDTARGAFCLGILDFLKLKPANIRHFLDRTIFERRSTGKGEISSVEDAMRLAVAAGTLKAGFFFHKDAFEHLDRELLFKKAFDPSFLCVTRATQWRSESVRALNELMANDHVSFTRHVEAFYQSIEGRGGMPR